jgi:hypothetical protein
VSLGGAARQRTQARLTTLELATEQSIRNKWAAKKKAHQTNLQRNDAMVSRER